MADLEEMKEAEEFTEIDMVGDPDPERVLFMETDAEPDAAPLADVDAAIVAVLFKKEQDPVAEADLES